MEHHGNKLRDIIKAKGFNFMELAKEFGVSRAAIDKHIRSERLTRKVLKPYAEKLDFTLDGFFESSDYRDNKPAFVTDKAQEKPVTGTVPAEIHQELQTKYFDLQERYNDLIVRFFPSAVQQVQQGLIMA